MLEEPKLLLSEQIILELDEKKKGVFLSVSRLIPVHFLKSGTGSLARIHSNLTKKVFSVFFALHCQIDDLVKKGK